MKEQKKTDNLLYVANKMDLARNHKCVCYVLMWIDRLWIYCLLSLEPFFSLQFVIHKRNTRNRVLISNQSILSLSSDFLNTCHSFLFGESELVTNDISSTIWISSHLTKFSLTEVNKINNLKKKTKRRRNDVSSEQPNPMWHFRRYYNKTNTKQTTTTANVSILIRIRIFESENKRRNENKRKTKNKPHDNFISFHF